MYLVVHGEDELAEARDRLLHRVEVGRRLAAAEVRERPRGVPQQRQLGVGGEEVEDGLKEYIEVQCDIRCQVSA